MTIDFDRRLQKAPPLYSSSGISHQMATTTTANYGARLPLQSRHLYSHQQSSAMSSSGEGCSSNAALNRLSTLESSNNDNNKARIQSFSTSNHQRPSSQHHRGRSQEKDSSTFAQTGAASHGFTGLAGSGHKPTRSESVGRTDRGRSKSEQRSSAHQRSTSTSAAARSKTDGNNSDNENVIIEEKRRRVNGDGYTLHRYLRGRLLGRGGFAKVYLCTALDTNKNYAVKIVPKANLVKARARQKLQAEIKIHRTLKHNHICEYKHFFEDRTNCYILLELCHNQSLNEMIKRRKRLTEPEAALFMRQLLDAVGHLHNNCVIHRDLKLGNLFLDRHLSIKVGDFGLATKLDNADEKRKTICGTPNYIAPEVIQGDKATRGHSFEVDIWSMGVILFTVLVGKPPYEAKDVKATYQRIIANEYSFPSHVSISENAKGLIVSMLQSKPEDRPSLQQIASHPFLTDHSLPACIPVSATHVAPEWCMNEYGELVHVQESDDKYAIAGKLAKKPSIPRASGRRPLGQRDPNIDGAVGTGGVKKKEKSDRDVINVQGLVRNALSAVSNNNTNNNKRPPSATTPSSSPFQIYDETTDSRTPRVRSISKGSSSSRPSPSSTSEDLVAQTDSLSVRGGVHKSSVEASRPEFPRAQSVVSAVSSAAASNVGSTVSAINTENDANILQQMLGNLETVMAITDQRKGSYHSSSPRPVYRGGPNKWVTRYVDYTSKYGLGFLLNDGSSGVYFNDSTKTVLEPDGETFQYIERRKTDESDTRNREALIGTHSLSSYPDNLQKKVTLLLHFHNYLAEQQKKVEGGDFGSSYGGNNLDFVFIKKWVRTKHAILFRLSNQTVQIVFYDQTEILLTPDERFITYVDKTRSRKTFHFNDELVGNNPDFAKRLKYTKEIMHQLMTGQRR